MTHCLHRGRPNRLMPYEWYMIKKNNWIKGNFVYETYNFTVAHSVQITLHGSLAACKTTLHQNTICKLQGLCTTFGSSYEAHTHQNRSVPVVYSNTQRFPWWAIHSHKLMRQTPKMMWAICWPFLCMQGPQIEKGHLLISQAYRWILSSQIWVVKLQPDGELRPAKRTNRGRERNHNEKVIVLKRKGD